MTDYLKTVREHFDQASATYGADNVWATMLYGSQNYNMATIDSDVDVKTMLFPTIRTTVLGEKMISTDLVHPDGSLNGVKDYRDTFALYLRGNVRFLETLYSDYQVVNPKYQPFFDQLIANRELIANSLPRKLMHSAAGMAAQKYKALNHPFPSKVEILAKYGYDSKQLHHLVRIYYFMRAFMTTRSYEQSLRPKETLRESLLSIKTNPLPKQEAFELAVNMMDKVQDLVTFADAGELPEDNNHAAAVDFLNSLALDLFKFRYRIEMEEE